MRILPTIDIGDPVEIYQLDSTNSLRLWLDPSRFENSDVEIYLERSHDLVERVHVRPFKPELTLSQVLGFLYTPAWVMATTNCGDSTTAGFELWYPELGILVFTESFKVHLRPEVGEMVLDERLAVGGLIYMGANADEEGIVYGVPSLDAVTKHGYPWPGFDAALPSFVDCTTR
jgi:hypothetical protein